MGHQQGNRRLVQEVVGHAAEHPLTQRQMTVSAHDDKVSLSPFSLGDQPRSDVVMAALDAMKDGVDPVMPEMIDGIDTDDRLLFGRALAGHDHDCNLVRPVQKRHGFGQGSGRFPAAVPGDKDTVEGDLWSLRLGNQIEVRPDPNRTPSTRCSGSIAPLGRTATKVSAERASRAAMLAMSSASTSNRLISTGRSSNASRLASNASVLSPASRARSNSSAVTSAPPVCPSTGPGKGKGLRNNPMITWLSSCRAISATAARRTSSDMPPSSQTITSLIIATSWLNDKRRDKTVWTAPPIGSERSHQP